jgi:hypothetical protein
MWRRAWVNAVDRFDPQWPEPYRISQNTGTGLLIQGTAEWKDYAVQACITPHMTRRAGLAARVQGLRRYYALVLDRDQMVILVKARDDVKVLDCRTFHWDFDATYTLKLEVAGNLLRGWVDDVLLFDVEDPNDALEGGGVALVCGEGTLSCDGVQIEPLATP